MHYPLKTMTDRPTIRSNVAPHPNPFKEMEGELKANDPDYDPEAAFNLDNTDWESDESDEENKTVISYENEDSAHANTASEGEGGDDNSKEEVANAGADERLLASIHTLQTHMRVPVPRCLSDHPCQSFVHTRRNSLLYNLEAFTLGGKDKEGKKMQTTTWVPVDEVPHFNDLTYQLCSQDGVPLMTVSVPCDYSMIRMLEWTQKGTKMDQNPTAEKHDRTDEVLNRLLWSDDMAWERKIFKETRKIVCGELTTDIFTGTGLEADPDGEEMFAFNEQKMSLADPVYHRHERNSRLDTLENPLEVARALYCVRTSRDMPNWYDIDPPPAEPFIVDSEADNFYERFRDWSERASGLRRPV